jgi:four helix bundle protein
MNNERLEQAAAWQEAIELAALVYHLTDSAKEAFVTKASLKNQIEHTALSVSNEIARGFQRGSNDLFQCLQKAFSATGEVRSMLGLMERIDTFTPYANQLSSIKAKSETCSSELMAWATSIHQAPTNGHASHDPAKDDDRRRQSREKRAVFEGLRQLNGM